MRDIEKSSEHGTAKFCRSTSTPSRSSSTSPNSLLSLVPLRWRQKLARRPRGSAGGGRRRRLRGARLGHVDRLRNPVLRFGWACSAAYFCLYLMTKWATVGFYAALWGGGVRGSMAQYLLVAVMRANQGRAVTAAKRQFMATHLLALIPWQPVVDCSMLSEKVEDGPWYRRNGSRRIGGGAC